MQSTLCVSRDSIFAASQNYFAVLWLDLYVFKARYDIRIVFGQKEKYGRNPLSLFFAQHSFRISK